MLTKEQKEFRRLMEEIKEEKGDAYGEMYDDQGRKKPWGKPKIVNINWLIRIAMFLIVVIFPIFKSGVLTPNTGNQTTINSSSIFTSNKKKCADYMQSLSAIIGQSQEISKKYYDEKIAYSRAKERVESLEKDLGRIKVIRHGEPLHEISGDILSVHLSYIETTEEIREMGAIRTKEEKKAYTQKQGLFDQQSKQLQELSDRAQEAKKGLLEKHNMEYKENEDGGLQYFY